MRFECEQVHSQPVVACREENVSGTPMYNGVMLGGADDLLPDADKVLVSRGTGQREGPRKGIVRSQSRGQPFGRKERQQQQRQQDSSSSNSGPRH
jgi:hypothetical protein